MSRRRGLTLILRPGFAWVSIPLPFGFRLGHRLTGRRGLPFPLPWGFRFGHKITKRGRR